MDSTERSVTLLDYAPPPPRPPRAWMVRAAARWLLVSAGWAVAAAVVAWACAVLQGWSLMPGSGPRPAIPLDLFVMPFLLPVTTLGMSLARRRSWTNAVSRLACFAAVAAYVTAFVWTLGHRR